MMKEQKLQAAKRIAKAHARVDSDVKAIFLLEGKDEDKTTEPIKLLEVVEGTMESGVEPISFAPNPGRGVPFTSLIIEVSPREYESMKEEKLVTFRDKEWRVTKNLMPKAQAI
jgi:hypothetical protein